MENSGIIGRAMRLKKEWHRGFVSRSVSEYEKKIGKISLP